MFRIPLLWLITWPGYNWSMYTNLNLLNTNVIISFPTSVCRTQVTDYLSWPHTHRASPTGADIRGHSSSRCRGTLEGRARCAGPDRRAGSLQPSRPPRSAPAAPPDAAGTAPGGTGPCPAHTALARTAGREPVLRCPNSAPPALEAAFCPPWKRRTAENELDSPRFCYPEVTVAQDRLVTATPVCVTCPFHVPVSSAVCTLITTVTSRKRKKVSMLCF